MEVISELKNEIVSFKGVTEGVFIDVKGNNLSLIKDELSKKINSSSNFFKGANFLGVRAFDLSPEDIIELKMILKYKYDFDIPKEELPEHIKLSCPNNETNSSEKDNKYAERFFDGIDEGMTKFVYGTLRSGQVVEYDGNIIIIGDVNPGAFIKANGNIIVLGTLRGVAHAGVGGNNNAIVAAYNLLPTQLRVGDIIVRSPDGDTSQYKVPEVAKVNNGEVVIEPYLPNK